MRKNSTLTEKIKKSKRFILLFFIVFIRTLLNNVYAQTNVVTISSSGNFTVPSGVSSLTIYLWGGGGAGGGSIAQGTWFANGGGGGGGACAVATFNVSSGQTYNVTIGAGGIAGFFNGGDGGTTTFSGPVGTWTASGGFGGIGGITADNAISPGGIGGLTGTGPGVIVYTGGIGSSGYNGTSATTGVTGTGGGGGGSFQAGTSPNMNCVSFGNGGNGIYPGGNGGKTPNCGTTTNATGADGSVRGGGGGGDNDWTGANAGGFGGAGQVVIVYSQECTNSAQYPPSAFAAPEPGVTYTITTVQYQQEYNHMTGAVAGHSFISTASIPGTFITVRIGSVSGILVASGISPLTWTALASTDFYIHYNTNNACGLAAVNMTTTITNTFTPNNFTATPPAPNASYGNMILLSDGTVICKNNAGGANGRGVGWDKLTPNASGNYANGTWSSIASMTDDRLWYSSQVLKDGRVYVAGAEYPTGVQRKTEVYNPLTNSWTTVTVPGAILGGTNSEIMDDGKVLQGVLSASGTGNATLIFNPATMTYSNGPSTLGSNDESIWVKLPDNSILFVDICATTAERYIPSTQTWVTAGTVPVTLWSFWGCEPGAAFLLPDGRAFFIGGSGATAFYTPSTNSWAQGPDLPSGTGAQDARAVMLNNGKILTSLCPQATGNGGGTPDLLFTSPTTFWLFDYLTGTFTSIPAPDGTTNINAAAYAFNYLPLPDGSVLCSQIGSNNYYVYTPGGTPLTSGKPVISSVSQISCTDFKLTGTKFTGISEGGQNEDDVQMATNYPIVRLVSGANVYYCRTHDWNSRGVQRGSTPDTTLFTLPAGLPIGTYSLIVSANGISSDPIQFTPGPYLSTTLTPPSICSGNLFFYTPSTLSVNATITWTRAAINGISNAAVTIPQSGNISEVLNNTTANPISVVYAVTLTAGTCSKVQNVTVVVNPAPVVNISASPSTICSGTTTTLSANSTFNGSVIAPLSGGFTSFGNAFNITATNTITIHYFSMTQSAGNAQVWYKPGGFAGPTLLNNSGWTLLGTVAVSAGPFGSVSLINIDCNITIPAGQTYGFVVVNNTQNVYSPGTVFGNSLVSNSDLTMQQGCGGSGFGGSFNFSATPRNFNGSVSYSKPDQSVSYLWQPSGSLSSISDANPVASPLATTNYSVTITDGSSCVANGAMTLTVNPVPNVSASISNLQVCNGSATSLSVNGGGPAESYLFSATNGTFTSLVGGISVPDVQTDDGASAALPLGFTFYFEGLPYTTFNASSNGILVLGNVNSDYQNALSTSVGPILAPLWDDLNGGSGTASYLTTGSAGNRIFTFQFLNWRWYYNTPSPTISFQVKLYEANGKIEYYYRQESGSLGGSETASIGIGGKTAGHFISLNNSSASPVISSSFETTTINSKPANGQVYSFTPSTTFDQSITYNWSPSAFLNSTTGQTVFASNVVASTDYSVTASAGGCTSGPQLITLTVVNCGVTLNLKAFIQGYYTGGGLMNNNGSGGCLYVDNIVGALLTDADTIHISAVDPVSYIVVDEKAGILQTNGNVSVVFGNSVVAGNSYYLKINHRNAVETWSALPVLMSPSVNYDFTNARSKAYGDNQVQTFDSFGWAIFSGDINHDGSIDGSDFLELDPSIQNGDGGYAVGDLNGDGSVDGSDFLMLDPNIQLGIGAAIPGP